jgi:hypothetical protein
MIKTQTFIFLFITCVSHGYSQKSIHYNLAELLSNDKLITDTSTHTKALKDSRYKGAVSTQKIVWLKDVSFKNGTIDIDLRGKDVFLQSFLGIAFHASDINHYELVYFRPFNFQYADTARRRWSLQYMVVPDNEWDKLRKEHPLVYENSITPPPKPAEWLHASIIATQDSIKVFVNYSATPSLKVKRLVNTSDGMIGLWDDELSGDFANLNIKKDK